jgi:hexulose-6-phosphate isomerase
MMDNLLPSRRLFLKSTAAAMLVSPTLTVFGAEGDSDSLKDRLYKTLKINMVKVDGSLTDKFKAAKNAGFAAIEMNAPGMNVEDTKKAIAESGLPVDGTVNSTHWGVRHSDSDPDVRAKALESLTGAIRDTHAVGGHTVLLVVGHGKDGTEKEVWERSAENIAKAIPVAATYGIVIAFENVWNHFLYDHEGDSNQTADKWKKYVDQFNSPWAGMQFDIGNHWKYGSMGDWIRTLGKRIVKLDVKGFSRGKNTFTKIGEGDLDFADVRKALIEINFYGYCAAEVGGGGPDRLKEISDNMDRVFKLA